MNIRQLLLTVLTMTLSYAPISASALILERGNSDLSGRNYFIRAKKTDSLFKIGQRYDLGIHEVNEANPSINPKTKLKEGTKVLIPHRYILPKPHSGIVINLAELRLYYFQPSSRRVYTYPIGIGRIGWNTPTGNTSIIQKTKDPVWRPPASIRAHTLKTRGVKLPAVVPAGKRNPLGPYALRLGLPGYLIHGTTQPNGIGRRVSSGCIRMFNRDITQLFYLVKVGTLVHLINQPGKLGWHEGSLYMESHQPLSDDTRFNKKEYAKNALAAVKQKLANQDVSIDHEAVQHVSQSHLGIPQPVAHKNQQSNG